MKNIKFIAMAFILALNITGASPCGASGSADEKESTIMKSAGIEKKWGVKPLNMRLTGAGHFLDFRYLVTDADKAEPILKRGKKAYLKDEASGKVLSVPVTKLGPLRGTAVKPREGRQYFILFGNTGNIVEKGSRVSVIIGDFKVENLTVQ